MVVTGWRAWYSDGRGVVGDASDVEQLPRTGLQIVMLYFDTEHAPGKPYRQLLCGGDFLIWNGHVWQSTMDVPTCPTCIVFPGSWMADDAFAALQAHALAAETL